MKNRFASLNLRAESSSVSLAMTAASSGAFIPNQEKNNLSRRWNLSRMPSSSLTDQRTRTDMNIRQWLQSLSFKTGVIVLMCCIPFYILSFAQMLLPISAAAKGILWTVLFGLAKTCQYGGLTILGVEGYNRLKSRMKRKKHKKPVQMTEKTDYNTCK